MSKIEAFGNSGKYHSFMQGIGNPEDISEPHLEGLIFGELNYQDVSYVVVSDFVINEVEEAKRETEGKTRESFSSPGYFDQMQELKDRFKLFLALTKQMGIHVYRGAVRKNLKPLLPEEKAIEKVEVLNGLTRKTPKVALTPENTSLLRNVMKDYSYNMEVVFPPGFTRRQHLKRYQKAIEIVRRAEENEQPAPPFRATEFPISVE